MGRGDLSRKLVIVAVLAAAAASSATAAVGVHWTLLASGNAEPVGSAATGYVAVTRKQEARFLQRLAPADQSKVAQVNLRETGLVAVFLDGIPCSRDVTVTRVTRSATTVTVAVHWRRPPIGMALCVHIGTPYAVVGVARAVLGRPAPTHVQIVAVARA